MRRSSTRTWLAIFLALAGGAILRLWFIHAYPEVQGDPLIYGDIAKNWMLHGIYGLTASEGIHPTLIRLPGYPLFLIAYFRLFGLEHYHAVMYVQTVIDLATCVIVATITRRIWNRKAAWVALWLGVLCPFTANYSAVPLTETLELFATAIALYALLRLLEQPKWTWILASALAWNYATLLRPDGALLAVALCPAIIWYGRKRWGVTRMLKVAVTAGVLSILPFIPWTIRNWHTFHLFEPLAPRYAVDPGESTSPGFNRWTKTICADLTCTWEIYWNANTDVMDFNTLPSRAFDSQTQYEKTKQLFADYNEITTLTSEIDDRFAGLAAERINAKPLRYYVWMPLTRLADMWLRPRTELLWIELRWWEYSKHNSETYFATAYAALNLAYLMAALIGLMKWPRLSGAILFFILLRCALLATIEAPEPRYTLECFPAVIALAAIGLTRRSTQPAKLPLD